jgi:D-alanyl-D-alanine carboxypeptidase
MHCKRPMNNGLSQALQDQLNLWQLFAPCIGANATIIDSAFGTWSAASGFAEVKTKALMPIGGLFYVYSITKTFTAIRVLQLAEQGAFSLDDPVVRHLREVALPSTVTIRRLLNHTSGLPSYTDLPTYAPAVRAHPSNPWSYDDTVTLTCRGKIDFPPGEGWHYSNSGYMLLLLMIEVVTRQSFTTNLEQGIIQSLKLQHTYVAEEIDRGKLVPGYCRFLNDAEAMENVIPRYHPGWCKTGLVISTTEEVAQFYCELFEGRLISTMSLSTMTSWMPIGDSNDFFKKPGYGLGLMIDPEWEFGGFYGHGGDGPDYNTWAMYLPDFHGRRLTLAAFCNTSFASHLFYLVKDLLRVLEGA